MLGLYIHVPFCTAICNYCNFNRGLFDGPLKSRYFDALAQEIATAGLQACATRQACNSLRYETSACDSVCLRPSHVSSL